MNPKLPQEDNKPASYQSPRIVLEIELEAQAGSTLGLTDLDDILEKTP